MTDLKLLSNLLPEFIQLKLLLRRIYLIEAIFNAPLGTLKDFLILLTVLKLLSITFGVCLRQLILLKLHSILINFVIYLELHPMSLFH